MADALKVSAHAKPLLWLSRARNFQRQMILQAQGNKAFQAGQFEEAIKHFTAAINLEPSNHVLYSNRSASHVSQSFSIDHWPLD